MRVKEELNKFVRYNKEGKPYFSFNTLHELSDLIELSVKDGYATNIYSHYNDRQSLKIDNRNFQGTKTMSEAIAYLRSGWDYGTQKLITEMKVMSNKKSMKLDYSVVGGQVSVPRMLQGLPTNMIRTNMVEKPAKIIDVYKSAGYPGLYTESEIIRYSAKALQIVEALESKGYRVNLYIVKLNKRNGEEMFTMVKVKNSSERLNIRKAAFCLANPAFQRRILWRLTEMCDWIKDREWKFSYGSPVDGVTTTSMNPEYNKYINGTNKIFIPLEIDDVNEFVKNLQIS